MESRTILFKAALSGAKINIVTGVFSTLRDVLKAIDCVDYRRFFDCLNRDIGFIIDSKPLIVTDDLPKGDVVIDVIYSAMQLTIVPYIAAGLPETYVAIDERMPWMAECDGMAIRLDDFAFTTEMKPVLKAREVVQLWLADVEEHAEKDSDVMVFSELLKQIISNPVSRRRDLMYQISMESLILPVHRERPLYFFLDSRPLRIRLNHDLHIRCPEEQQKNDILREMRDYVTFSNI